MSVTGADLQAFADAFVCSDRPVSEWTFTNMLADGVKHRRFAYE